MKVLEKLWSRVKRDESGLSLVESVVAIVVLGILAVAAYPLMFHSLQAASLNNLTTSATITVQNTMEKLRGTPTCATVSNIMAADDEYADARGIKYRVIIETPNGCVESDTMEIDFRAIRVSDGKSLLKQKAEIFIPPLNGSFNLD